jgi:hypothetical protein
MKAGCILSARWWNVNRFPSRETAFNAIEWGNVPFQFNGDENQGFKFLP